MDWKMSKLGISASKGGHSRRCYYSTNLFFFFFNWVYATYGNAYYGQEVFSIFKSAEAICQIINIINDPFVTDDDVLTFIEFMAFMAYSCNQRTDYILRYRHGLCLDATPASRKVSSWMLPAVSSDVTGIFSRILLPIEYFYQEAPSLDCYRLSQNTMTAVTENLFKTTDSQRSKAQGMTLRQTTAWLV